MTDARRPSRARNTPFQSFRDLSLQVKIIIVLLIPGIAFPVAYLVISNAIQQFEIQVSESRLQDEQQLVAIRFEQQTQAMRELAMDLADDPVLGPAVAIGSESSIKLSAESLKILQALDYIMVLNAANEPLYLEQQEVSPTLDDLLAQALQQEPTAALLYTEQGWLLTAVSPIVDFEKLLGVLVIGQLIDDEFLSTVNLNRTTSTLRIHGPDGALLATSRAEDVEMPIDLQLWEGALAGTMGQTVEVVNGAPQFVMYAPLQSGDSVVSAYSVAIYTAEIRALQRQLILQTLLVLVSAGLLALVLLFILIRQFITKPLFALGETSERIAAGDLDTLMPPASGDEIGRLTINFGHMVSELRDLLQTLEQRVRNRTAELAAANKEIQALNRMLKQENLRLNAELEVTRQLQEMLLPKREELEAVDGLDIAGYMRPADEVGGDYYDVLQENGQVKIGIGDVTDHGLESGVVMLMTQTAVRTLLNSGETDPVRFMDILNRTVYNNVHRMNTDRNLTLSLIDYSDGEIQLSGQHEDMIVMRRNGSLELVDTTDLGFPIGLEDNIADFISHTKVHLEPGDGVVLYTDGIPEAENLTGEPYGMERFCEVARRYWDKSAGAIKDAIIASVEQHIGEQEVFDDITLVVIKQQ